MNAHHQKRVRQLMGLEGNDKIPDGIVSVVERVENMLAKLGSQSSLRAADLALLIASSEQNNKKDAKVETVSKMDNAKPISQPSIGAEQPVKRGPGRPRKVALNG